MSQIKRLILIRHGETDLNTARCFQGLSNPDLSNLGLEQAKELSKCIKESKFSNKSINTSELIRAENTGKYISESIFKFNELNELSFGNWESKTSSQVKELYPLDLLEWYLRIQNPHFGPTNGETFRQIGDRIEEFLNSDKLKTDENGNVLIVTHVYIIKAILDRTMNLSDGYHANRLWLDTGSITIIDWSTNPNERIIHRINWTPKIDWGTEKWLKLK
jgi:ribonuclease H / adenosylcobalamin/alpha-ribazole phosphatase